MNEFTITMTPKELIDFAAVVLYELNGTPYELREHEVDQISKRAFARVWKLMPETDPGKLS